MSKEMMIVFVYDTECCKNEEDDPASAVIYFHPSWVSDHQRLALSGQLMGSIQFLTSVFSSPRIVCLESGKFAIRNFGRYILAVGTDRNIPDWVIDHRADILSSLITVFHCNFETILQASLNIKSTNNFKDKIYQIFETYLPILQYGGNTFANVPMMQLPKSANNVFLEAIQILQCCQDLKGVLGGAVFYHNKIVATQINAELTKLLVMTDPYRIKCTAEAVKTHLSLPEGIQILQIYVDKKEYNRLKNEAENARAIFDNNPIKKFKKFQSSKQSVSKEPVISAMKRDQSIIFTTVPEEDSDHTAPPLQLPIKKKLAERPRSLSLFSTTSDIISADKKADKKVTTPFRSQASVCATPIAEKVVHGNVMSICCNPDEEIDTNKQEKQSENKEKFKIFDGAILKNILNTNKFGDLKRSFSLKDIKETFSKISKNVTMKSNGVGLSLNNELSESKNNENEYDLKYWNTITDPFYPIFGCDGLPISNSLYNEHVLHNIESLKNEIQEDTVEIKNFDCDFKNPPTKNEAKLTLTKNEEEALPSLPNPVKQRRSLSLPLKSLTLDSNNYVEDTRSSIFTPIKSGGIQLTPLMSKLTILAMDEKSGITSQDNTPMEIRDFSFEKEFLGPRKKYLPDNTLIQNVKTEKKCEELEKATLFICGQQNMVLMLLIENEINNSELVESLEEICNESLGQLESQLHQCLDPCSSVTDMSSDPYSYMCLDPSWDIIQRGGPWSVSELAIITHLHKNFTDGKNLTEVIVRNDDSIIYAYQCGQTELFYQQNSANYAGLPTPADLMGTVPLKAKRRLERDHAIILL